MKIEKTEAGQTSLITITGDVNLDTSRELRTTILETISAAVEGVALDLSAVRYMDSSGVAILVEGLRTARDTDKTFTLVSPSPRVMKVLELTRLDTVFEFSPSP